MQSKNHWETVYSTKLSDSVSWFQPHANSSINLIRETDISLDSSIIDIGGGASMLVDDLLENGFKNLSVLDISAAALSTAKNRLGDMAVHVQWIEADITQTDLLPSSIDVWHDRAVFHFLTTADDRRAYIDAMLHSLKPEGHVIMATFAEDGPIQCSGLPIVRYTAEKLYAEIGDCFSLVKSIKEAHQTPTGSVQQFIYCHFHRKR
jgi:2-polyprenyl-3-methyl-5-hydroxy-6-metoxy-1,4-benzoquinol methylase